MTDEPTTSTSSRVARLWSRARETARRAVTEPESPGATAVTVDEIAKTPVATMPGAGGAVPELRTPTPRLLKMSPFTIGFLGATGALIAFWLFTNLQAIQSIIMTVVVSLFLALGLNPIVEALQKLRLKRWLAVLIVLLALGLILALGSSALVPMVITQINNLVTHFPGYLTALRENQQFARLDARFNIVKQVTDLLTAKDTWTNLFGGLLGASKMLANTALSAVVTLVLTIYFLSSLPQIKSVIYQFAPASKRPRARQLADEMFSRVGGYLTGMFLEVTCTATGAFIMMNVIGLGQYALALAFVVALFAFIPIVGNSVSMVVIAIIALSISPTTAIIVIIYFLVYMQIDAYLIQPRIMQRSVDVPGAVTVVAAMTGGTLLGIVGALIAIPTAAVLLLLYREVLVPHLDRT